MNANDTIPNFDGTGTMQVGEIWPSMHVPAITGRYFFGKVRLAAKLLENDLLSFEQVAKIFCAYEGSDQSQNAGTSSPTFTGVLCLVLWLNAYLFEALRV